MVEVVVGVGVVVEVVVGVGVVVGVVVEVEVAMTDPERLRALAKAAVVAPDALHRQLSDGTWVRYVPESALQEAQERGDRYEAALREIEDPLLTICPYFSGDAERLSEACDTIDAALNPPATPTNRYDAENAAIQQCAQAYDTESCVVQVVDKFARPIPPEAPDA